jgi:hypothetical protein
MHVCGKGEGKTFSLGGLAVSGQAEACCRGRGHQTHTYYERPLSSTYLVRSFIIQKSDAAVGTGRMPDRASKVLLKQHYRVEMATTGAAERSGVRRSRVLYEIKIGRVRSRDGRTSTNAGSFTKPIWHTWHVG